MHLKLCQITLSPSLLQPKRPSPRTVNLKGKLTLSPGVWPVPLAEAPGGHHLDILEAASGALLFGARESTLGGRGHYAEASCRRHRYCQLH